MTLFSPHNNSITTRDCSGLLPIATAKESRFYFDTGGLEYLNQFKLFSIFPAIKTVKTGYNYLNSWSLDEILHFYGFLKHMR